MPMERLSAQEIMDKAHSVVYLDTYFDYIKSRIEIKHLSNIEHYYVDIKNDLIKKNAKALIKDGYRTTTTLSGYSFGGTIRVLSPYLESTYYSTDIPIHYSLLDEVAKKEKIFNDFSLYRQQLCQYLTYLKGKGYSLPDFLKKYDDSNNRFKSKFLHKCKEDKEFRRIKDKYHYYEGLRLILSK